MRLFLLLSVLAMSLNSLAFNPNWNHVNHKYSKDGNVVNFFDGKTFCARASVDKNDDLKLIKFSSKDEAMVIDTREFHKKHPERRLLFRIYGISNELIKPDCKAFLEVEMAETSGGVNAAFELEGQRNSKKNNSDHFWNKPKPFLLNDAIQTFRVETVTPSDVMRVWAYFNFVQPGIYEIGKLKFGYADGNIAMPSTNQIINPGAERGMYNVAVPNMKRMGYTEDGNYFDYFGETMEKCTEVNVDDKMFHSGSHSFRLRSHVANAYDRFCFNPVKYYISKPLTFSVWMKADKKTQVALWLHVCAGTRYAKDFWVGTDWAKYSLTVTQWGKESPGVSMSGAPANSFAEPLSTFYPSVLVMGDATVWVDDAAIQYKQKTDDDFPRQDILMKGELDSDKAYYKTGEPIRAELEISSPEAKIGSGVLSYKLLDFFGNTAIYSSLGEVSLPFKKNIEVYPPKELRGPVNLIYSFESDNSKTFTHTFYGGIIDLKGKPNPRFGVNITERSNAKAFIQILKDFRIGAVRLWWDHNEKQNNIAALFHDSGFYVLYCLSFVYEKEMRFFLPMDYTEYLKTLQRRIKKHMLKKVDAYEIFNEPNIWTGRSQNPDPGKYRVADLNAIIDGTRIISDCLRRIDPGVKIAGPSTCHTMVPWIYTYLEQGGKDMIDIITEHPYRILPELPDYASDIQSIKTMSKRFNKHFQVFSTENGSVMPIILTDNRITDYVRKAAARDIRMALVGFSAGLDKYFHYTTGTPTVENAWENLMVGHSGKGSGWQPGPFLYAAKTAADMLEDVRPVGTVNIGIGSRCYIFDRGDKRVAVLWKWSGTPTKIIFKDKVVASDFVGTKHHERSFSLDEYPLYIESELDVKDFIELIKKAEIPVKDRGIYEVKAIPCGKNTFKVDITNHHKESLSGRIYIDTPKEASGSTIQKFAKLASGETRRLLFETRKPISVEPQTIKLNVEIDKPRKTYAHEFFLRGITVPRMSESETITVDGDLSDWPSYATTVKLDNSNAVFTGKEWTENEKKINAELRLTWNNSALYIAVVVHKDKFLPENKFGINALWKGDGLQVAFDTTGNANSKTQGYQDDDFEYSISEYNNYPVVIRDHASAAIYDSLFKSLGQVEDVTVAIKAGNGTTVYEMAFPQFSISPFQLQPGSTARFNIIVNVSNGKERRGWLELTPGIGKKKLPGQFLDIILEK